MDNVVQPSVPNLGDISNYMDVNVRENPWNRGLWLMIAQVRSLEGAELGLLKF